MTELEFGERLKQYRKAKNMTQQELAERLGVSNKSVSRWESGSYPDVATLAPLAKTLEVTVDELLGEAPSLRSLKRADWQNLLSFAFAIGGGVLFFLLDLFVPTLICYLIYLGCMAYGVYLQKHYTYHSKWFQWANLVMDFFVNLELLASPVGFAVTGTIVQGASTHLLSILSHRIWFYAIFVLIFWLLLAAGATAITAHIIRRGRPRPIPLLRLKLSREFFAWKKTLPALCPVLLTLYWCLFYFRTSLPEPLCRAQNAYFIILLAIVAVVSVAYLLLIKRPWMLIPDGAMLLGCLFIQGTITNWVSYPYTHTQLGRPTGSTFVLEVVLVAFYLLCCFVGVKKSTEK